MKEVLKTFLQQYLNILKELLRFKFFYFYFLAIFLTAFLVFSGLDWRYFLWVMENLPHPLLFISDILGFLIAVFLPVTSFVYFKKVKTSFAKQFFQISFYSVIVGYIVSTFIKMFTGRVSPPDHFWQTAADSSHLFQFGFMNEQIIGGWPSSHTTIIFALAFSLTMLYNKSHKHTFVFYVIAFFVGLGVTFGFHWLSEFVAGIILGSIIGQVVGDKFISTKK